MKTNKVFLGYKSDKGVQHFFDLSGCDFTLCGLPSDDGDNNFTVVLMDEVTCPNCIAIMKLLKEYL